MAGLMEGKAGLVTGAAGGIGRASALALAREGAAVVVNDLPSMREAGEETVRLIEEQGGRGLFAAGDVSRAADNEALVARTLEAFGTLDLAHNNAGVELQASITETEEDQFDIGLPVDAGSTAF